MPLGAGRRMPKASVIIKKRGKDFVGMVSLLSLHVMAATSGVRYHGLCSPPIYQYDMVTFEVPAWDLHFPQPGERWRKNDRTELYPVVYNECGFRPDPFSRRNTDE